MVYVLNLFLSRQCINFCNHCFSFRKIVQGPSYRKKNRIDGKVVIITGCNTGIGKETALELASRGAKIYMACRDPIRCEGARLEIIEKTKNQSVFNRTLDLGDLQSVRKFAEKFVAEESRLDILVNNAGVMATRKGETKDGFDLQLGTNHLGHFLLTNLLLDTLKQSAPSRIVVVSSALYGIGKIRKDDLNFEKSYSKWGAYAQSKLANVLFTTHLSEKLKGSGVTVNCLHPGVVKTELTRHIIYGVTKSLLAPVIRFFFKTAKAGAQTSLRLALDPALEKSTGGYYFDTIKCPLLPKGTNKKMAEWLWTVSEDLVGLRPTEQITGNVPLTLSNATNNQTTIIEVEKLPPQHIPDNRNLEECEQKYIAEKMRKIMEDETKDEPEKKDRPEKMEKLNEINEVEEQGKRKTDAQEKFEKLEKDVDNSKVRAVNEDPSNIRETAEETGPVMNIKNAIE